MKLKENMYKNEPIERKYAYLFYFRKKNVKKVCSFMISIKFAVSK